jgi:hypothetical protein
VAVEVRAGERDVVEEALGFRDGVPGREEGRCARLPSSARRSDSVWEVWPALRGARVVVVEEGVVEGF